jgi:dTDP-glucose 4,6-dehydratase
MPYFIVNISIPRRPYGERQDSAKIHAMTRTYFANKKVLVTGGAGFIGSAVASLLYTHGAAVTVLDNLSSGNSSSIQPPEVDLKIGNICDYGAVRQATRGKDIVIHMAARPFVPYCYDNPIDVLQVNTLGSANVALASIEEKVERFVFVSSSEVYGSNYQEAMSEESPTEPFSTYAVSKLAGERACFTMSQEHGLPIVVVRPFNTYGPADNHPRIIPTIIAQLYRSSSLRLGNLDSIRDLTYVSDTARGIVDLASCDDALGQIVNLGTGKGYSARELVPIIASLMGKKDAGIEVDASLIRPRDPGKMVADFSKARSLVGWEPKMSLERGLEMTIEWYRSNGGWSWQKKMEAVTPK